MVWCDARWYVMDMMWYGVVCHEMGWECLLVAERPSSMRVYLRDGSAQTILRAATPR